MKSISVLGCGWLGLPLAEALIKAGFSVKGSTTTPDKIARLKTKNIAPFLIKLTPTGLEGEVDGFFSSSVLFVNITPGLRAGQSEDFTSKIASLINVFENTPLKWVIFVSSTSVFRDSQGKVDEQIEPKPETESGRQLWECEKLILQLKNIKTTVLRLGGLVGVDRHPVKYLSGLKNLPDGDAFINFIHRDDVISLVFHILKNNIYGIVHGVAPHHPKKRDYYLKAAQELGIKPPEYTNQISDLSYKKVYSARLIRNWVFEYGKTFG